NRHRIVIAGGGVAALEAMFAMHHLTGGIPDVQLLCPNDEFLYGPVTVAEAFGRGEARSYNLRELAERAGATVRLGRLAAVEPGEHAVRTADGALVRYDSLVVAVGGRRRNPLPGALAFGGRADVEPLRALLAEVAGGAIKSVAFALAAERAWPIPIYERALMTGRHARGAGRHRLEITIVTPEEEPLALFGPDAGRALEPMLRAHRILVRILSLPAVVEPEALVLAGGARVHADRVVTLPVCDGPFLPGLPHDAAGFVSVDQYGRVLGLDDIYAAGDITTFPLKQGGLAAQQADAVAEQIAAVLGVPVTPRPFTPVLRGMLLGGPAPLFLRAEPHRMPRACTVAIDPTPLHPSDDAAAVSDEPLWWPPAKVAGVHLAPELASSRPIVRADATLQDRAEVHGPPPTPQESSDAADLALLLAESDARWGDYNAALAALDSAEGLRGVLPDAYIEKRRRWQQARRHGD